SVAPTLTALHPNYPNPFNPETWIPFDLSTTSVVTITLYDMRGRQVRRLELGALPPGRYRDKARAGRWDGRNDVGEAVGSGVYIAELRAGSHVERRRIVILK
ncbi:MAG: T9SS type A sorting domain-containing protein, partial [Candidatus Poribacteria bacterium]